MSEQDTFGPRLRSERERRGISLETIVTVTKVGADLWLGLERNDFSKWPSGIFARAFIRDYAKAVGLDADEVVDEFCRLFPIWRSPRRPHHQGAGGTDRSRSGGASTSRARCRREGDRRAAARERKAEARARRIRLAPRTVVGRRSTSPARCRSRCSASAVVGRRASGRRPASPRSSISRLSTILTGASRARHAVAVPASSDAGAVCRPGSPRPRLTSYRPRGVCAAERRRTFQSPVADFRCLIP